MALDPPSSEEQVDVSTILTGKAFSRIMNWKEELNSGKICGL
jgi:hypothetical protein